MSIRNKLAFDNSHWDWGWLDGEIQKRYPKISGSDIDWHYERNGHNLFFETKRVGQEMLPGQIRKYNSLSRISQNTIIILYGSNDDPLMWTIWPHQPLRRKELKIPFPTPCTREMVVAYVLQWFSMADHTLAFPSQP